MKRVQRDGNNEDGYFWHGSSMVFTKKKQRNNDMKTNGLQEDVGDEGMWGHNNVKRISLHHSSNAKQILVTTGICGSWQRVVQCIQNKFKGTVDKGVQKF